jgi:glycolate oxidase
MNERQLPTKHHQFFLALLGDRFLFKQEDCEPFGHDETEDISVTPIGVGLPINSQEVSQIASYCYANDIPLTPSGGRTGLSGGAIPSINGFVVSLQKMNKIIEIDERNAQVITEPGVITEVLQNAVKEKGLFYPPDPSSRGTCFIGGNIAENSGGPKAVKYGVTKDYVLNLELVLPSGEIIWTGANVLKNSTGYNLTQLVVGSEGTLGIVTKIVLKLLPHPKEDLLMLVPFRKAKEACEAVSKIYQAGIIPSGLEFMERDALTWTMDFLNDHSLPIKDDHQAHLLIELDGNHIEVLLQDCEKITSLLESFDIDDILFADDSVQKTKLWRLRRTVGEAVKSNSIYKEEDTVVPRYYLPELLTLVKDLEKEYGFKSVCYGHAGDGNLHVNIVKVDMADDAWNIEIPKAIRRLFEGVVKMGGTISGEHGIGLVQKPYMDIAFPEITMNIMRSIKKVFDPKGLMNPGKIFD